MSYNFLVYIKKVWSHLYIYLHLYINKMIYMKLDLKSKLFFLYFIWLSSNFFHLATQFKKDRMTF